MSRIISLSVDNEFANSLDILIEKSGYKNRSRFLRDAALFFAEIQQKGELLNMDDVEPTRSGEIKEKTTTPYMTKYEKARVLGTRALQIRC